MNAEQPSAKCACTRCGGHIEFPLQMVGQAVNCPHCGQETALLATTGRPLPGLQGPWPVVIGLLIVVGLVAIALLKLPFQPKPVAEGEGTEKGRDSNSLQTGGQSFDLAAKEKAARVEGAFGLVLGEPLPANCSVQTRTQRKNGTVELTVIPPTPNPAFETYTVTLDATERLVASISAMSLTDTYDPDAPRILSAIVDKLRERYGREDYLIDDLDKDSADVIYHWRRDTRTIGCSYWGRWGKPRRDHATLHFYCHDEVLQASVDAAKPPVDTRGLP